MEYMSVLSNLYFLLVHADGDANEKEIAVAKQMIRAEGFPEDAFKMQMELLKAKNKDLLFDEAMVGMKSLERDQQIRIVAWLSVVANADGFMDRTEWQLIYQIYHKELALPLHEIFDVQKELNRLVWEKTSMMTIL
jgi:uncharacterized tellurite resistance protein B-like protein